MVGVIHLAIGTLEAIGTTALVVVRVAVAATDGAAPAVVLTRPRRAWIKFDIAEGTCGRQARRGKSWDDLHVSAHGHET